MHWWLVKFLAVGLVQYSSITQSCPNLCDPMDCSTWGSSVLHYLLEFAQTHVHWVGDAIQPSHLLSPSSSPAVNLISIRKERRQSSFLDFFFFFWHFHCQGRVCSLVRKLRSHKPPRAPPTNKKKKKKRYILYAWGGMEPPVSEQGQKGQRPYPLIYWDHQSDGPITIFLALRVELEGKSSL